METLAYIIVAIFTFQIIFGLLITLFLKYELHWWIEDKLWKRD